jgi:AraC-like DNA-binding protein
VLIHPTLDCHQNLMVSAGVKLIRLCWRDTTGIGGLFYLDDVDELARAVEKDVREALRLLESALRKQRRHSPGQRNDWPDLLLTHISADASAQIGEWAESNGLSRETVSRGFEATYGVQLSALRAELRTRSAWLRITRGSDGLSGIAADTGFADQAHMTRWIRRVTGKSPSAWRSGQACA